MRQRLEAPGLRYSFIWTLNDFADPTLHKKEFCSATRDNAFYATVDEPIECIFDVPFEDSCGTIGVILRDMSEIESLRRLGVKLRTLQKWILRDGEQKDSYYMDSDLWREITCLAKESYDLLMKDEDMDLLYRQQEEDRLAGV
jgi:hypothetical protein